MIVLQPIDQPAVAILDALQVAAGLRGQGAVMPEARTGLHAMQTRFPAIQASGLAGGQGAASDALLDAGGLVVLASVDGLGRGGKGGGQGCGGGEPKDERLHFLVLDFDLA
jgi:hypothetical protein